MPLHHGWYLLKELISEAPTTDIGVFIVYGELFFFFNMESFYAPSHTDPEQITRQAY